MSRGRALATPHSGGGRRLTQNDALLVVSRQAATRPLPTQAISGLAEAAFPDRDVTNLKVYKLLQKLQQDGQVVSYSGETDAAKLKRLGVPFDPESYADRHARYWMLKPSR